MRVVAPSSVKRGSWIVIALAWGPSPMNRSKRKSSIAG